MGLVDGFLLLGLFLFGLPIAAGIGALLGRLLGMPRLGGCLPGVVLLAVLFGVPLSLRVAGVHGAAHVAAKREAVTVLAYTGASYHTYGLELHFRPRGTALGDPTARVVSTDSLRLAAKTSRERFDRTRVGDVVDVVYLPFRPSIGRLADRTLLDLLRAALAVPELAAGLLLLLAAAAAVTLSRLRLTTPAVRLLRAAAIVACIAVTLAAGWTTYQNPRPTPESAVDASAVARIVEVRRIDRTLFSFDVGSSRSRSSAALAQPFDVVEVAFTPPALGQEVHATDAVDAGSAGALRPDAPLSIRYASALPRTVRLVGGTRTYRARNAAGMATDAALTLGVLLAVLLVVALLGRKRAAAAQ